MRARTWMARIWVASTAGRRDDRDWEQATKKPGLEGGGGDPVRGLGDEQGRTS